MHKAIILVSIVIMLFTTSHGQITIKVVAEDTTDISDSPMLVEQPNITDLFIDEGFRVFWGRPQLQLPEPMLLECLSFKIKRYAKLKTFEIILLDFNTIEKELEWYEDYPELDIFKKQRFIYEGNKYDEHFNLLDSIADITKKERKSLGKFHHSRIRNVRYRKRLQPISNPVLNDFFLQENESSDNFILTIVFKGEEINIPVGLLVNHTNAKRIQKTYSNFFRSYSKRLNKRRESRSETEKEYSAYLEEFPTVPLNAEFLTKKGDRINPTTIYVIDYRIESVYEFQRMEDVFIDPRGRCSVVIVDANNRVGMLRVSEFSKFNRIGLRQLVFELKPSSEELLAELLTINS